MLLLIRFCAVSLNYLLCSRTFSSSLCLAAQSWEVFCTKVEYSWLKLWERDRLVCESLHLLVHFLRNHELGFLEIAGEALSLLEVGDQLAPFRIMLQGVRITDDDNAVLGSGQGNIGSSLVFEETELALLIASDCWEEHEVDFFSLPAINCENVVQVVLKWVLRVVLHEGLQLWICFELSKFLFQQVLLRTIGRGESELRKVVAFLKE